MKPANKISFCLFLVFSVFLSGCQTGDPYTGEQKVNNASKYGGIAAVVCGLIGATESSKRARNAAAGCGIIGASVGAYMDKQEAELRRSLENTGVGIQREGDQIRLIMPGNITFDTAKADLKQNFYPVLDSVVTVLTEYDQTLVVVDGYTDSTGSMAFNMQLSDSRARSVANYLQTGGILQQRLVVNGYGPANPVATNGTPEGRQLNRRVEITLRAIEAQN